MSDRNLYPHSVALGLAACLLLSAMSVNAQLGISRSPAFTPAADAMLDVSVASIVLPQTKLGILVPRVTRTERLTIAPNATATGLIVYQTNDLGGDLRGYWYWDGAAWIALTPGPSWELDGNTATTPGIHAVGTSDNQNFRLRTNGTQGVTITAGATPGRVGVNTATTTEMLELSGGMLVNGGTPGTTVGNIRGVPGVYAGTTVHQGYVGAPLNGWYQLENVFQERINQAYPDFIYACAYPQPAGANPDFTTGAAGDFVTIGTGAIPDGSTLNSPYATFWEDHRVQYLYTATEMNNGLPNGSAVPLPICSAPEVISGLSFRTTANTNWPMEQVEIKMANTTATGLTGFITGGLTTVYTAASYTAVLGWNVHAFSTPFAWNGSSNVVVEYCFNNSNWDQITGLNSTVAFDATTYSGTFGSFCDACGSLFGGATCFFASCPNTSPQAGPGVLCTGFSHAGGCQHTVGMSLATCDGTFQFQGSQGNANRHPQIRFYTKVATVTPNYAVSDYIYTPRGVMVGDQTWAASGVSPSFAFKGPGTIVAQNQVWGGSMLLQDHVFDTYYGHDLHADDAVAAKDYRRMSIDEMTAFVEEHRHLPTIPGREEWEAKGGFSVDELNTKLWLTAEDQALHITELNERMDLLQKYLIEKRLSSIQR